MSGWITANAFAQRELAAAISPNVTGCTVCAQVRVGLSGTGLKLVFAEDYGQFTATYLAAEAEICGRWYPVLFDGSRAFSVSPGERKISDEIPVTVQRGDLLVLFVAVGAVPSASETTLEQQHSLPGNFVSGGFEAVAYRNPLPGAPFNERLCGLKEILVKTEAGTGIAAFGDSVTESAVWVDPLAERIAQLCPNTVLLNLGIGGNRLLRDTNVPAMRGIQAFGHAGLKRLESDVFSLSGVKAVILAMGINDIAQPGGAPGFSPPPEERCSFEELRDGLTEAIRKCREHGLSVVGATITPFLGFPSYEEGSAKLRRQINAWILESGLFDAVMDLAVLLCDGADTERLNPAYGVGDGLHPNPVGGAAAAAKLDIESILKASKII